MVLPFFLCWTYLQPPALASASYPSHLRRPRLGLLLQGCAGVKETSGAAGFCGGGGCCGSAVLGVILFWPLSSSYCLKDLFSRLIIRRARWGDICKSSMDKKIRLIIKGARQGDICKSSVDATERQQVLGTWRWASISGLCQRTSASVLLRLL